MKTKKKVQKENQGNTTSGDFLSYIPGIKEKDKYGWYEFKVIWNNAKRNEKEKTC